MEKNISFWEHQIKTHTCIDIQFKKHFLNTLAVAALQSFGATTTSERWCCCHGRSKLVIGGILKSISDEWLMLSSSHNNMKPRRIPRIPFSSHSSLSTPDTDARGGVRMRWREQNSSEWLTLTDRWKTTARRRETRRQMTRDIPCCFITFTRVPWTRRSLRPRWWSVAGETRRQQTEPWH